MTIHFKPGVDLNGITPEALRILVVAGHIWKDHFPGVQVTCTSALDGQHSTNSLHYVGRAVDIRTHTLPGGYTGEGAKRAARMLGSRLGPEYDVVLEKTHIHVEHDPK